MSKCPEDNATAPPERASRFPRRAWKPIGLGWACAILSACICWVSVTVEADLPALSMLAIFTGFIAAALAGHDTATHAWKTRKRPTWDSLVALAAVWLAGWSIVHPAEAWLAPAVLALHRTMGWAQYGGAPVKRRVLEDKVSLGVVWAALACSVVAVLLGVFVPNVPLGPTVAAVLLSASPRMHAFSRLLTLERTRQRAGALGIHVKRRAALSRLRPPMTVVFVPESTLYDEIPAFHALVPANPAMGNDTMAYAASWALLCDVPESKAILQEAHRRRVPVREARALRSFGEHGASFESDGHTVLLGSVRFLRQRGISLSPLKEPLARAYREGRRPILVACGGEILGALVLEDTPRRDTVRAIKVLDRLGMQCAVLTGHPPEDYRVLAEQCGIMRVLGDVDPEDRRDAMDTLRGETIHPVALVTPRLNEPVLHGSVATIYFKPGAQGPNRRTLATVGTPGMLGVAWLFLLAEAAALTHGLGIAWMAIYHIAALLLAMSGWLHPLAAMACAHAAWLLLLPNANRVRLVNPEKAVAGALARRVPYQP